jgi:hypothetical protein
LLKLVAAPNLRVYTSGQFASKKSTKRRPKMRVTSRLFAAFCATFIGLAAPLWSQNAEFAPVAPTTGTLVFNFTITASSAVPRNGVVVCNANASVNESSGQSVLQKATGIATLSGGKWLCKASMPYSWALATATSDKVFLNYSVEIDYGLQVTATNGTTTVAVPISLDKVNANLGPISVPLNGATTTETVSATI